MYEENFKASEDLLHAANKKRRKIPRAGGEEHGWWNSTLYSYAFLGDDITCQHNFRMNRATMELTHNLLSSAGYLQDNTCRSPNLRVPGFFKLSVCLYYMAHGRGLAKVVADCGSLGESTVRKYIQEFCDGVFVVLKPIYMPMTPPSAEQFEAIRANFAARRGVPNVGMAVDGTHIPFAPTDEATKNDYHNYKGWYSILVLAWVNSFYLFVDADVGHAGRAGDNGVMKESWMFEQIQANPELWLGKDGMVAADGGASDGGVHLLNPIARACTPEDLWYNFCHSSTRCVRNTCNRRGDTEGVYMYAYIYTYPCVFICKYTYICIYMYIYVCIKMDIYIYIYIYTYIYLFMYTSVYMWVRI